MPTFIVRVRQFLEEVDDIEVEATDPEEARQIVLDGVRHGYIDPDWREGDGACEFEVLYAKPAEDDGHE